MSSSDVSIGTHKCFAFTNIHQDPRNPELANNRRCSVAEVEPVASQSVHELVVLLCFGLGRKEIRKPLHTVCV